MITTSLRPESGRETGYTIEKRDHGVLVFGDVPVGDLAGLVAMWKKQKLTLMDTGIAAALGATMAITSKKGGALWRAEIDKNNAGFDDELRWLKGTDTGCSSLTIFSVLSARWGSAALTGHRRADIPYDPDDFGRCHRLLERFPAWRTRLPEVAAKHKQWAKLVAAWDELTALWLSEVKSGKAPKLWERMQQLR